MTSQNILVTGGAGFIGTHLCRQLVEQGHSVTVLDLRSPATVITGVRYILGDVRNLNTLTELLRAGISTVYHLAAVVSVPLCQGDPLGSYSTNFTGTLNVLEAIRLQAQESGQPPARLVFASTAALYGSQGDDGRALQEKDVAPRFSSFYAAQKRASEQAIDLYCQTYGIPSLSFRFFNVFGPGQDPASPYSGVITVFARLAKEGKPLPLNDGGRQTRDFISVFDIVDALFACLKVPTSRWKAQAVNLGTEVSLKIQELAEIIRDTAETGSTLVQAPPRPGDVLHSLANIQLARDLLQFQPRRKLHKAIQELLKTF